MYRRSACDFVVGAVALLAAFGAQAQTWPAKAVRVVVPFAPGGGADLTARPVSQKLSEHLGQQFVVDNRGGAAGAIGMEIVAKSLPDGYTIMVMSSSFSATPATRKLPFDLFTATVPVVEIGHTPSVVVVHPSLPVHTTRELIDLARARPGQLIFASTGVGGATHLVTELFASMAKIKMIHVPYKSTGLATVEVVAGHCQLIVGSLLGTVAHFRAGKLRALAVTSAQRWHSLPKLPAVAETLPGFETVVWYGVWVPRGTPQPIVERLNATVNRILEDGNIKKWLEAQGMAASGGAPSRLEERARKDYERWVRVVKDSNIRIE
ncbi:MAG: tripartite tricarboxylate transporter substrate binding protein [Betaproteobacteria bacterium]|nr:tripartite tricarboxylate transporter substrate binding protein [Betaproteobacteria bacterium]